jgi:subtilase family serine protease
MRYPAKYSGNYPSVISVGGTNNNDELYHLSNYARNGTMDLVLVAPAQNIVTTTGTGVNAFTTSSGTSYSAPLVAGTIALMYSVRPQMNKTQVRNILIRGCDKPAGMNSQNYTTRYGYGRLNSFNCVSLCLDSITGTLGSTGLPVTINGSKRLYWNLNVAQGSVVTLSPGSTLVLDKFANLCFQQFGKIKLNGASNFIQRRLSTVCDRGEFVLDPGSCYLVEDSANFYFAGPGPGGVNDRGCIAIWGGTLLIEDNATLNIAQGGERSII